MNVTLLTSQLLSAPALWTEPEGLRTSTQSLSVFHSAAQALIKHERALREKSADADFADLQPERTLPKNDWIKAIILGADHHSPRWRHLLVLGGLLLGFGSVEDENLSGGMRATLESAFVTAVNLALEETSDGDDLGFHSVTLVLNYCFPLLADHERSGLNYDALLPVLMRSVFNSPYALRSGYFIGAIDADIRQVSKDQFQWSERSSSFQQVKNMLESPLVSSLGPLSRLISHALEQVQQPWLVSAVADDLETFARTMHVQWRQNKLSEIDPSEEGIFLDNHTLGTTAPQLWKLMRSTLFAVVIILRSVVGRTLSDGSLAADTGEQKIRPTQKQVMLKCTSVAPMLAIKALNILRNLYFVSTKTGSASFSQYTFVYLTSMDILGAYSQQAEAFLQSCRPAEMSGVPEHPVDRNLDLFFLNTAEHFTLVLSPRVNEDLLLATASRYLTTGEDTNLLPIFEAAHSVMLAVFCAPQNADLTKRHLPFYIDALFQVFPQNISARQFRLAFKTLLRLTSPPAALAVTDPMLSATLLELLHERATNASPAPLPPKATESSPDQASSPPLSEQAIYILTMIDTLTQLQLDLLDEWLPLAANLVNAVDDSAMREYCRTHFWHILVGGEMDPNRSGVCHEWWSTGGGRDLLLFGREDADQQALSMSGALPDEGRDVKL